MDVLHTAIEIHDLEAMRAFYEDFLGLEFDKETESGGVRNYFMKGTGPAGLQLRITDSEPSPSGIHHIAIQTPDVEVSVEEAVDEWGSELLVGPKPSSDGSRRIAFITDPEGYTVELIEEL